MKTDRFPSPLQRELFQAAQLARTAAFAEVLRTMGLGVLGCHMWGIEAVSAGDCFDQPAFYQPDENGKLAAIVPAFEGGDLVDLVACSFATRAMHTRKGIATVLGFDWIEDACLGLQPLIVYDNALSWLHHRCRGVVVIDWTAASRLLRDVPAIQCESDATAAALKAAFERPNPYPPIYVHDGVTK